MKIKALIGAVLLAAIVLLAAGCDGYTFSVKNEIGKDIYFMYVLPSSVDWMALEEWPEDVLGDDIFENSKSRTYTDTFFEEEGTYNFWFEDEDGDMYAFFDVDVATAGKITVTTGDIWE